MALRLRAYEKIGLAVVIGFLVVIALGKVFGYLEIGTFNPPNLVLMLNILFIAVADIAVAAISAKSFLRYGQVSFLLLTGALTIDGVVAALAGWAAGFSGNANFTIFNMGMLIASIIQVFGVIYLSASLTAKLRHNRKIWITLTLLAAILSVVALTIVASLDLMPPFFMQNGLSSLGGFVILLAIFFYALGSVIIGYKFLKTGAHALYWYSLALAISAIGLVGFSSTTNPGDISQWLGRITYYIGSVYFIVVVVSLTTTTRNTSEVTERWFETFGNNREQLAALSANMLNGFAYLRIVKTAEGNVRDGIFLEVNDAFESSMHLKREEVIGKGITETTWGHDKTMLDLVRILGHVAQTGEATRFETQIEELQKWLRVSSYSPQKGYVVLLIDDITESKMSQQKIEEYSKNLETMVEEKTKQLRNSERLATIGQVAGMVGHDIRNPLQAINSEVYLAKSELEETPCESPKDESIKESLHFIEEQTAYIQKIVSDLQDLSKPLKPELTQLDLCNIVSEALTTIESPRNIEKTIICPKTSVMVEADPVFLKRIITNLVTNAIQAMPKGGKLAIDLFTEKNKAIIIVMDTGVGIPKENQERLFTPLFTTKPKGQGFGLVIIKRMTEALGGSISFESEVNKGTKFTLSLPYKTRQNDNT